MKVQCPECKEIVVMDVFETSSEGLRFVCPECQRIHFIENKDNLDQEDASRQGTPSEKTENTTGRKSDVIVASPELADESLGRQKICPKCGHAQTGGTSCHKCGLDFLRFDPSNLPPDPKDASRIWNEIEHNPQDQQLHEEFIKACNEVGRLDYATRQYRILSRLPGMANIAQKMQTRILSLAQAQLVPGGLEASSRDDPKKKSKIVTWLLLLAAMGGVIYLVYASSRLLEKMY